MSKSRKALLLGGSLGGLFAANFLLHAIWDVHVYERVAEEPEDREAGIVTHLELSETLPTDGTPANEAGVAAEERVTFAQDGSVLARRSMPLVVTAWESLYSTLKIASPKERCENGYALGPIAKDENEVQLGFSNGHRERVVAADRLRSTTRQALVREAKPVYAGYVAWRGPFEESVRSERALTERFPYFTFGIPPQEQMIAYPVSGLENGMSPGMRRFNFVWYRPANEAITFKEMVTNDSGRVWMDGISPPLIRRNCAHLRARWRNSRGRQKRS